MAIRQPSLVGVRAKRARAQHHFNALEAALQEFFGAHPYSLAVRAEPDRSRYIVVLRDPRPIPEAEWATMIGDCVHNLRAVFDFIAWELAGGNSTDRQTQFPVCDTAAEFNDRGRRQIRLLRPDMQDVIEHMQPFQAAAQGRDIRKHFLRAIHMLDIADKHKLLTLTVAQPMAGGVIHAELPGVNADVKLVLDAIYTDNADIVTITLSPNFVPDVQFEVHANFDIAFHDSIGLGEREFVLPALKMLMQEVDVAVDRFFAPKFF